MAAYKDYYATLGIGRSASDKEIRSAFRKLAAKHHPDKNPGNAGAEERFKEINEAYTVLSDPEKRKFYDQYGSAGGPPPFTPGAGGFAGSWTSEGNAGDFSDFFQQLFGSGFGGGVGGSRFSGFSTSSRGGDPFGGFSQPGTPVRQDVKAEVAISLEEAYHGGIRTVSLDGRRLEVKLPQGTKEGSRLRLRGQAPGGGDVYLTVKLEPHPLYTLDGDDIRISLRVPDYTAALGGTVRVPTLDGEVDMVLPPGTQSGRTLRLRSRGWPKKDGTRGDVLAEVRVVIPERLSKEQLELYERLRALSEQTAQAAD